MAKYVSDTKAAQDLAASLDFTVPPASGDVLYWDGTKWASSTYTLSSVSASDTKPSNPSNGHVWWNTADGTPYIYYTDGTSSQWVEFTGAPAIVDQPGATTGKAIAMAIVFG